jgi:hypothetical protein
MYSVLNCHNVAKHAEFYLGSLQFNVTFNDNAERFKKSFTTLEAYINLIRGYVQCLELSQCSKTRRILRGIVTVQCDFQL